MDATGGGGRAPGEQAWAARDAGPGGIDDQFGGMALSSDGSTVYVARSAGGAFVVVARDAATGERRWTARTTGPDGAQIFVSGMAADRAGSRVFVTGQAERTLDTRSPLTVAYDASDGSLLWSAAPAAPQHQETAPRRIVVAGGRVFVTGSRTGTFGPDDFWDYWTVAYSAATGARRWRSIYAGSAHGGDTAEGLAVGGRGRRVFVTGTSASGGSDGDIATVAYDARHGSRSWVARYGRDADDVAVGLVAARDGSRVYVAGYGRATPGDPYGLRLLRYDGATGAPEGVGKFSDGDQDLASGVALSADGSRAFVAGSGGRDFLTVAFDTSTMSAAWNAHYDGGHGIDSASAVAVSPRGTRVDVTGASDEGLDACFGETPSTAIATVEYRAGSGTQRWVARYAGHNRHPDRALAVAVSHDASTVFVAGDSDSECTTGDVATVAYGTGT
jgi:hypothetical protein